MRQFAANLRNVGMRYVSIFLFMTTAAFLLSARTVHDPAGFRVDFPEGWRVVSTNPGRILINSPDNRKSAFLFTLMSRTSDCARTLQLTLPTSSDFPQLADLRIARPGSRMATAQFTFRGGKITGAVLCAETGRNAGMLYGISAPVAEFDRERPQLLAVLRSVAFEEAPAASAAARTADPLPPLRVWKEPQEMAYTIGVPQGWRATGGIHRIDVTHYTSSVDMAGPDGSMIRIGDQHSPQCTVPGPGAAGLPPANGTMQFCAYQTAAQYGDTYVGRRLSRDWSLSSIEILSATDRPDLARQAEALPASMGLKVRCSVAEVKFRGIRNGNPIMGAVLARTTLFHAVQGQNFILGTLSFDSQVFAGPADRFAMLARLTGAVFSSMRIDPRWWSETQRINREVAERTLALMRTQAENQQQAFWDRMAASDRRREAVNDILGGTVRLTDGQGHQYRAKAGSNYYFQGGDAVIGTDVWPSPLVDLTPLEVIR